MDSKKRRSTLRKSIAMDMDATDMKTQIKRRISFSGKNSVRVFHGEEEPKTWNNSYEISDHLNVNETASNLGAPSTNKIPRSSLKNKQNKENVGQSATTPQDLKIDTNHHHRNASISNNLSILSTTKDLINVSYNNQNSKMCHIENSVDITLYEREMQFQVEKNKAGEETNNLYSFSLEDNEKEERSIMCGERTIDFMRELSVNTSNVRGVDTKLCDFKDDKCVTVFSDYMDEDQYIDFTCTNVRTTKEPITIFMNDSLSMSSNERDTGSSQKACKRKTIQQATAMQLSPNMAKQYDKENVNPTSITNKNETINYSCEMDINEDIFSLSQKKNVNVEKESLAFQEKLNRLSFLQESDDNMQTDNNFNKIIELSPMNESMKSKDHFVSKNKARLTITFNNSMEIDSQNTPVVEFNQRGAIPKVKSRPTINFNQPIETSPPKVKSDLPRQTINLNEDICESPVKLTQETQVSSNINQNVPGSIRKHGQLPKLVVRKICTPLVNKTKNPIDLEQQRLMRYKKKQEQNVPPGNLKDVAADVIETKNQPKADKSLNFSLTSVKNMSLSPESSSPLIPFEFKAFNLKQLNDEIERGKINVFANVPKTPSTDRKARNAAFNIHSKHVQSLQPSAKQRRTLVFDVDIPISSDDTMNKNSKTAKSNNHFDFNITQDVLAQDRKNKDKCRYSQADDLMLDNTSFLTRAKLSDETVSRNSSKREVTQLNDIMDLFDESLRDAASKLDRGLIGSSVKTTKSFNKENDTLSSMFQNAKPIFTQTITNIKGCNKFMDAYDLMDISTEVESSKFRKHGQVFDRNSLHRGQTIILNDNIHHEPCDSNKDLNEIHDAQFGRSKQTSICSDNEMEIEDIHVRRVPRQTLYLNEAVDEDLKDENNVRLEKSLIDTNLSNREMHHSEVKCARQTTYLNNDIEESNNTDAIKDTNEKVSIKATIIYDNANSIEHENDFHVDINNKPIGITVRNEDGIINTQCTDVNGRKRQTMYPNEDIVDDIDSGEPNNKGMWSVKAQSSREQSTEREKAQRLTTYFENNSIIDENLLENNATEYCENRHTLMCSRDINLATVAIIENPTEKNTDADRPNTCIRHSNTTRKTLYFHNEIPLEAETTENNIEAEKPDTHILHSKPLRKTMYFNNEIPLEKESTQTAKNVDAVNSKTEISNSHSQRKTLYFNNDISFEKDSIHIEENIDVEKPDTFISNSKPTRKTLHFNNEVCELDESKAEIEHHQMSARLPLSRKSIHIAQDMDVTLNEVMPEDGYKSDPPYPSRDHLMDFTDAAVKTTTNDRNGKDVKPCRKSIYTAECMDLALDVDEHEGKHEIVNGSHVMVAETKLPNAEDCSMDLTLDVDEPIKNTSEEEKVPTESEELCLSENNQPNKDNKRKTIYFDGHNEISFDQSFTPAENYQFPEPVEPLNAAKMTLARHISSNSLTNKSKITNKQENALMTPLKCTGSNSNHRMFHMTPRLSLLEFTAAENKAREEECLLNRKYLSPLRNESTNKRLPVNLTPVLSLPKKRQTLVFDDCLMDESDTSPPAENSIEQMVAPNEQANDMEETMKQEPFYLTKSAINNHDMEMSGIVSNESLLQTPTKQRKSRIPIPISSGKKSSKSFSLLETSADNHIEPEVQLDMEGDNLTESIQFMRRATTFTQRRDTSIKGTDLHPELVPAGKTSIFEGNPITISDVSVFFEAQRNSNSLVPQTEKSLALEQIDMSGFNAIEKAKKSLENRYINLTLEDIEKTRLSLVRISYEDQEDTCTSDTSPPTDAVVSEGDENNAVTWKNKRRSVNYLRNVSAVCRKCKRCQDTVLNETTSSASDSFVLPPLPPLPDLGLDRLRRLRKRPAIVDVNILWQRVSLDRTLINPLNISDDDSQIMSDVDDAEDESSPVIKCIRKYEKEMLSFERDLLEKHQTEASLDELPFVLRLDALLSANSTNWTFDFQMQSRGILLFTHKRMFTFSALLTFNEIDPLGHEISLKSVKLVKGHVMEKNWKAIDFVLDFQLKLNLPFDLQSLCESSDEAGIFKMLQTIDRVVLDTITMGNHLQRISFSNQASIIRDESRTYVRKIIRKIVSRTDSDSKYVEKTEIKVELLNLKKLSFKDIASPPLHHFREDIHLLPTGLQFLQEFLPNPCNYLNPH